MKKVILALLPALFLVGCSDKQAKRIADEDQKITDAANARRVELDQEWNQLPQEVQTNLRVKKRYESGLWRLDNALRYINPGRGSNSYSMRQPDCATADIEYVLSYDIKYLQRASKAPARHHDLTVNAIALEELIKRICPGNQRAQFHLRDANADLRRAKTSGYGVELLDTASQHLDVAKHLAVNPLEPLPRMHLTVRSRDRLQMLDASKSQLSPVQSAHLDAARKCLEAHREALALTGNQELLAQTAAVHLNHVWKSGCKTDEEYDKQAVDHVDLFEKIITTELFVQENCANNQEAVKFVKQAHENNARWRTELTKTWWWSPNNGQTVTEALQAARRAIAKHPRTGTK